MKSITVVFEDKEFSRLKTKKGEKMTWRAFILQLLEM